MSFTTAGTYFFDPTTIPNHQAGDTIFNFTTITIASGVTVRLDSRNLPGPVYWLATGAVQIAGILDLSGLPGHNPTGNLSDRAYSTPGAGGFAGGPGGGANAAPQAGSGPGRGAASGGGSPGGGGSFSGSQYLIPLVGGSGAGGSFCDRNPFSSGGGAGGGAVLIASSSSIVVAGAIGADGGPGGSSDSHCVSAGAGGSGGAIRLMAPSITISGYVSARGPGGGGNGFIRFETFQLNCPGNCVNGTPNTASLPFKVSLPTGPISSVKVTSVAGISVNANPFSFPDAIINSSSPVPVVVTTQGIPPGAIPTLYITSEQGADQIIAGPPLAGTVQSATSTVNVPFPPNGSRGLVRVTWSQ